MRWILITLILLFLAASGAIASPAEGAHADNANTIEMLSSTDKVAIIGLGESVKLKIPDGVKIHLSDGAVVRTRILGDSVILTGRRTGRVSLRFVALSEGKHRSLEKNDRTIFVTEKKIATTARLFHKEISRGRGLILHTDAFPQLLVKGELLRIEDWERLVRISRDSKIAWRLEAEIFSPIKKEFTERIQSELRRLAWPGHKLSIDANGPTLTGGTESASISAEQKLYVTTLGVQIEISSGLTELEPMIRTQIVIAEIRRNRSRTLGVSWSNDKTTGTIAQARLLPSLQIPSSDLLVSLQAIEDEGDGKILAMPNLLCRSGGEAKFMAGGEIPIRVSSHRSASVEWKKYGIQLNVQPKADRMKRMRFQLGTEISTIDGATKTPDGLSPIFVNRIDTQFNLNGPQTIVLSGLIKSEESESTVGIPLLKSIPVLGSLFQSEGFRKNLTELLIFVSPEVIIPDDTPSTDGSFNDNTP